MNVVEIIFSPTGGTEKVVHIIGGHWNENAVKIDLSDSKIDFENTKELLTQAFGEILPDQSEFELKD